MNILIKEKSKAKKVLLDVRSQIDSLSEKLAVTEREKKNSSNEFKTLISKNSKLDRQVDACVEEKKLFESNIAKLEFELNASNVTLKKMNAGSKALDEMLSLQKMVSDKTGLGYQGSSSKPQKTAAKTIFVKVKTIDLSSQKKSKVRIVPAPPKAKEKKSVFEKDQYHQC